MMTSCPVPEGFRISPLHENLFCLTRRDRNIDDIDLMPPVKNSQENFFTSEEKPPSFMGDRKVIKEKKAKSKSNGEKIVYLIQGTGESSENKITSSVINIVENGTDKVKRIASNDLKHIPLSLSYHEDEDHKKVSELAPEHRETNKNDVTDKIFSANLTKEESLRTMSGQVSGKNKKQNSSRSVEKTGERRVVKSYMGTALDTDSDSRKMNHIVQKASFPEHGDLKVPSQNERSSIEARKKQKGVPTRSDSEQDTFPAAETLKVLIGAAPKVSKGTGTSDDLSRDKVLKSKSKKSINGSRNAKGSCRDSFERTTLDQMDNQLDMARPSADRPKVCIRRNLDSVKLRERSTSKRKDHQFPSGEFKESAPCIGTHVMGNGEASDTIPAASAPVLIEENWVQCDSCQKWRLLPFGITEDSLPEKWLCSMLSWL